MMRHPSTTPNSQAAAPIKGRQVNTSVEDLRRGIVHPPMVHDAYETVTWVNVKNPEEEEWDLGLLFLAYPDARSVQLDRFVRNLKLLEEHPIQLLTLQGPLVKTERLSIADMPGLKSLTLIQQVGSKAGFVGLDNFHSSSVTDLDFLRSWRVDANLSGLSGFPSIQRLSLSFENIETLDGIEKFQGLQRLDLALLRHLSDISSLAACQELIELRIEFCKSISDYNFISRLEKLERFFIYGNHDVKSFDFLDNLSQIKEVVVSGINIVDGNLSRLAVHEGISVLIRPSRKHYDRRW